MQGINEVKAIAADALALAELRVDAMRPSLEAIGRFNPERARDRFLSKFQPESTTRLLHGDKLIGFYVVQYRDHFLWLDHLYITPEYQNQGIAGKVVDRIQQKAAKLGKPVRLMALKGSRSNDFYLAHGFTLIAVEAFDNIFEWQEEN